MTESSPSKPDAKQAADADPEAPPASARRAWPLVKRLWPWVRPHMGYVVVMATLLVLSTPLSMVSPLIVRRVVDDAVLLSSPDDVLFWGAVLVGLTLASVVFGVGIGYSTTLFHTKVLRDLRMVLYTHVQRLSVRYYSNKETGWMMSRQVDDVGNLGGVLADTFARTAIEIVRGLGYAAMIFYVEWRLALGGLVLAALIFGFEYIISGTHRQLAKATRETWTEVSRTLHQALSGYALVQATASERREAIRFASVLHDNVRANVRRDVFRLWTNNVFSLIGGVAPTIIVLAGVYLIVTSDFTVGGLFAFFMYLMQMFGSVGRVISVNPRLQSSLASLERIYEVLDTEREIIEPPDGARIEHLSGGLVFEGVSFAYEPGRPVLSDICLEIAPQQMVALVGPSGAGKSTLAQLVPRFYDPDEGTIRIDGTDLRDLDLAWYRRHVGLVPQEIFLFDRTVADNIAYGAPRASDDAIQAAASAANALEFIEAMPEGFQTLIGERGVKLSGGQRQRLAIAREILRDPQFLILDEATSSLDSETEALIQSALAGCSLAARRSSLHIGCRP